MCFSKMVGYDLSLVAISSKSNHYIVAWLLARVLFEDGVVDVAVELSSYAVVNVVKV